MNADHTIAMAGNNDRMPDCMFCLDSVLEVRLAVILCVQRVERDSIAAVYHIARCKCGRCAAAIPIQLPMRIHIKKMRKTDYWGMLCHAPRYAAHPGYTPAHNVHPDFL